MKENKLNLYKNTRDYFKLCDWDDGSEGFFDICWLILSLITDTLLLPFNFIVAGLWRLKNVTKKN